MGELIKLLETCSGPVIFIAVLLLIGGVFGIVTLVFKVKEWFEMYHAKRAKVEKHEDEINNRFTAIETAQAEDHKQIMALKDDLSDVKDLIVNIQDTQDKADENQKRANRAQSRSAMGRMAQEILDKGYMTETEAEILDDLLNVFKDSVGKGDSFSVPNIVSKALNMEVLTPEEIARKHHMTQKHKKHLKWE